MPHRSATRLAGLFTARRARRHAARAGHRARATLPEQGCSVQTAQSSPACSEHSARVLRTAPLPPRAWSALHEARAWHAARALRHPFSPLSSLPAHSTEHTLPACLHTQHTAPCARIRLTTQPAPHNNSLPHASPRRLAHTASSPIRETAARASARLQFLRCILRPSHSPRRRASPGTHRSSEDVSRSMGYRPSPRPSFYCHKHKKKPKEKRKTRAPCRYNAEYQITRGQVCVAPSTPPKRENSRHFLSLT